MNDLLPCPFCGRAVEEDLSDTLYRTTPWWYVVTERKTYRTYGHNNIRRHIEPDGYVWTMHCPESCGGCGAEIHGDSEEEAKAAWNRRAPQ